jgi:NAD(P)-dependent dehydrogenase (short-subunit alcohol dehydrogenase family)
VSAPGPDDVAPIEDWNQLLRDRVAVVTGGGDGIGGAISKLFAQHGALVEIAEIDFERADRTRRSIEEAGGRVHTQVVDVTDPAAVERTVEAIVDEHGRLDILVQSAGLAQRPATLAETSDEVIERLLAVNVKGVLYCARAAARPMVSQEFGRIINIASQAGKRGVAEWAVYCASKAAVVAATQSQALELAAHGVTVNAVCPGAMLTTMTRETVRLEAEATGADAEELLAATARAIPVGRLGTPAELGEMVAWIASERSSFTTGASFNLTGGASAFF